MRVVALAAVAPLERVAAAARAEVMEAEAKVVGMVAVVREAVTEPVPRVAVKQVQSPRPFCSCTAKAILSHGGATDRVGRVSWICSKLAAPMPETVLGRGNHSTRSFVDACAFSAVVRALPPITTRRGPALR